MKQREYEDYLMNQEYSGKPYVLLFAVLLGLLAMIAGCTFFFVTIINAIVK